MAAQSKLELLPALLTETSLKAIISEITTVYLKHRKPISRGVFISLFVALLFRIRNGINEQKAAIARSVQVKRRSGATTIDPNARKKVELNREFFKNLLRLLRICIPSIRSKEMRLLVSHSIFLLLRTLISLYVASLDGKLVSHLVRGRGQEFL